MSIILIGMSGSGKTTIGESLSRTLKWNLIDTDSCIVEYKNMTIDNIFSIYGEKVFRDMETKVLETLPIDREIILSTGGGIILREKNIEILKKIGTIYYLESSIDNLYRNLKKSEINRPLIDTYNPKDSIKNILVKRRGLYEKFSDYKLNVDGKSIEEIKSEIVKLHMEG